MSIITVGIDLAKNVFAVHGVDDNGKPALVQAEAFTRASAAADRLSCRLPDRHGSLLRRPPLGAASSASTATPCA
jgi:hypothetical protein